MAGRLAVAPGSHLTFGASSVSGIWKCHEDVTTWQDGKLSWNVRAHQNPLRYAMMIVCIIKHVVHITRDRQASCLNTL